MSDENVSEAVRNLNRAIGAWAAEDGDTYTNGRQIDADIRALIAAVREDEKQKCIAAVESLTWARQQELNDVTEAIQNA